MVEPVADDAVLPRQAARHLEALAGGGLAGVDERGGREHLLHRAGLVGVVHRPRAEVLLVGLRRLVGVEGGHVGQGEDLTGAGVHHDGAAARGAVLLDRLGEHLLGEPLEVAVDGGAQRRAVLRGLQGALAQRDAYALARGGLPGGLAVDTGELLVEGALEAAERLVGAHVAEQVGRDVARRVVADRVVLQADAGEAGRVDLGEGVAGQRARDASRDVLVAAALLATPQRGQRPEVVDGQPVGQQPGDLGGAIGGELGVRDDHLALDGVRERDAVAVEDVAALGDQRHPRRTLGCGAQGVRLGVDALQLDQPRAEERQDDRDEDEPDAQSQHRRSA